MILKPRRRKTQSALPMARTTPHVHEAMAAECARAGVSVSEGLRQLVKAYNAQPWPLVREPKTGAKRCRWPTLRLDEATTHAFTQHAASHGVSVAEALRQVVSRYLAQVEAAR